MSTPAAQRVTAWRQAQSRAGMKRVDVYVPADRSVEIRLIAAEMREGATMQQAAERAAAALKPKKKGRTDDAS